MNEQQSTGPLAGKSLVALVWRHCPSKYHGSTLVVLLKLAGLTKPRDGQTFAWPSVATLARSCGIERRRVQRILAVLKTDGILKIRNRKGHSSHFYIRPDAVRALPLADPDEPSEWAVKLSEKLHQVVLKEIDGANPQDDWTDAWPVAVQTLLDRGHSKEKITTVTRQAIDDTSFRPVIGSRGAVGLVDIFEAVAAKHNGGAK